MMKRDYSVDLFRIIATVLVVVLHVLGQGGILESATPGGAVYWTAWFLEIGAYCAVNCFALISGYVMVNKSVKVKSIVGLWFQVLFYSLIITALFYAFLPETRTIKNIAVAIIPVFGKQWWYISSYFALFFFIPVLNKAINHISQQTYKKVLLAIIFGIGILDCIIPTDVFNLKGGYSAIWLIIVYLFGAYIRKYDIRNKTTAFKSLLGFFAMIILTLASKFVIRYVTERFMGKAGGDNTFISYISITILMSSIYLFLFCLNIKIGKFSSKIISFLSPATLGVYLIHVHPLVFSYIIKDVFVPFAAKPLWTMLLYVFAATMSIYLICTVIEWLRILFFKLIRVNKWCESIDRKVNNFFQKSFNKQKQQS